MNRLASFYVIPYLDLGVELTALPQGRAHWQNAAPSSDPPEDWEAVVKSHHLLRQGVQALRLSVTVGPPARLRQACVALVQAYAEFCPSAEFSWLNGSAPPHVGRGVLNYWLTRHDQTIIAARIAGALTDASAIYRCRLSSEEVVQEAARSNALVLAQGLGTRLFFWRTQQVQGPWENYASWETLWALGLRAKQMQSVDHSDFGKNSKNEWVVEPHGLTSRVDRLKDYLPEELCLRVKGLRGSGLYRLDLPANEIYMANVFDDGVFEVGGSSTYREVRVLLEHAAGIKV
jgi:hypothetical protein